MVLEVLPEHKLDHQTVLVSGSDCISDENNSIRESINSGLDYRNELLDWTDL